MIGSVNQLAAYWTNLHGRPRCTYEAFDWHQRSRDAQSIPYDAGGSRWRTGRHDPDCRVEHHAFGTIVRSKRFAHRRDRDPAHGGIVVEQPAEHYDLAREGRSEEHQSELQALMRISSAGF